MKYSYLLATRKGVSEEDAVQVAEQIRAHLTHGDLEPEVVPSFADFQRHFSNGDWDRWARECADRHDGLIVLGDHLSPGIAKGTADLVRWFMEKGMWVYLYTRSAPASQRWRKVSHTTEPADISYYRYADLAFEPPEESDDDTEE